MSPPERRECVPTSSGAKPSLAASTRRHSADSDDVECADGVDATIGGKIADGGGWIASMVVQEEEFVDAYLE